MPQATFSLPYLTDSQHCDDSLYMFYYMSMNHESTGLINKGNKDWHGHAKGTYEEVRDNRATERARVNQDMDPWPYYDRNVTTYIQEFGSLFPELNHLKNVEGTLFVDLFGLASADSLSAESIGLTLDFDNHATRAPARPLDERRVIPEKSGQTVIMGNALQTPIAEKVAEQIRSRNKKHIIVFWRPIGGAGVIEQNPHASARLYALFEKVFEALPVHSVMYLDVSQMSMFQVVIEELGKVAGLDLQVRRNNNGVRSRITKQSTEAKLPSWKTLVRNQSVQERARSLENKPLHNRWSDFKRES